MNEQDKVIKDELPEEKKPEVIDDADAEEKIDGTNETGEVGEPETAEPEVVLPAGSSEPEAKNEKKDEQSEGLLSFLYDILELTAISLAAVMIILTLFMRHSPVKGSSMYPTIMGRSEGGFSEYVGKDVLLISNLFYTPKTGDIVVIQTPTLYPASASASMDHAIVKRVIAVGGDTLKIDFAAWRIWINGEVFEDGYGSAPYVNYPSDPSTAMRRISNVETFESVEGCTVTREGDVYTLTIPEGMLFVMGDNRNNSNDSRSIGLIDERWVVGKELLRIYPLDRFGTVD